MAESKYSLIILAGGESRRMGRDKADLDCHGRTFLEMQLEKGAALGIQDVLVSGYRGERKDVRVVPDQMGGKGPLGGLETCLRLAKHQKCLVLSVDMPLIPVEELEGLLAVNRASGSRITILKCGDREQPLAGVYDTSLADAMLREITERKGSVFGFLNAAGYTVYEASASAERCANINTPESYQTALKLTQQ